MVDSQSGGSAPERPRPDLAETEATGPTEAVEAAPPPADEAVPAGRLRRSVWLRWLA